MYDTVRRNILTLLSVTILITAGTHANSTTTPHRTTDYLVSTTSNINYTEPSSNNEEPSTSYISERDDLRDILSQDVYQEYQWSLLEGFYTSSEWSYWTYCVACLSNGMEGSVQLRHRAGIEPSIEARNCTQDQPLCPDITYRGLWYYNKVVGNFLSEVFPEPPIYYPFSTNEAMEDEEAIAELEKRYHLYRLRYCSQKIKESGGAKYIAMTSEGCYGSNYSDIFNYGVDTRTYSSLNLANRMQVYIYSDCPNYCRQVEESGLCLCYFYVTPPVYALSTASQTDAISMCAHENSIILPLNYSQYAVTFIDALLPGRIWLSSGPRDELSYTCRDFTENQTIVESDECNPNDTYQVLCLYNDAVQYEWTFWTPWSSCSSACGGGFRDQRRYRLAPESPGESVVYSPLNEGDYSTCNDDVCPWYNSTNHTVANLYPKWAGCWLSNNVKSIFTMYEAEMILDGDKFNRREFVEKCAIATQGVGNVYAVRMRLCYVGNISSAYDYNSTGASDLCDRHGRTSGRGYDIYFHSNATADPQWGKYFTAENVLGSCSLACGGGFKTEIRSCNNPPPTDPGTSCPGAISREVNCNTEPCPEAPFGYSNLGCYHAEVTNVVIHYLLDGAVPGLRRDAVRKCALVANSEGALVFGVVQLGHCVLSSNLHCEYSSHNVSSQCFQGMGSSTSISMYALHDENGTIPLSYDNICPGGSDKSATTEAPDPVTEELEKQVAEILELDSISPEQTSEALATLEDIISNQDLTPQSVKATTDLLTALADRLTFEPSDHSGSANSTAAVLNEVVKIIDILTQDGQQEAWAESQKFTSLLTSIESIALKSAAIAHSGGTSRVAISIQLLNPSEYTSTGYSHTGDSVGVYLPPEVFSHQNTSSDGGQVVSMVTVSYTDVSEFIGEPVMPTASMTPMTTSRFI